MGDDGGRAAAVASEAARSPQTRVASVQHVWVALYGVSLLFLKCRATHRAPRVSLPGRGRGRPGGLQKKNYYSYSRKFSFGL